ncbi:hypothetical protein C3495_11410 [Clostridiaceae bacterium 14S0207]|nr:hypothetical protein C3495_11410 [Clostridiaceae bacterium 14S0207]
MRDKVGDKKIVLNIIVLIVLMMVLTIGEVKLNSKLKLTAFSENNINELKQYKNSNGKLSYLLPKNWITDEEKFNGGEITYHNEFRSPDRKIYGYVQLWNKKGDLKDFLYNSKEISAKQNLINNYKLEKFIFNNKKAYKLIYDMQISGNNIFRVEEYFIDTGDQFVRVSFSVNKQNYRKEMERIFKTIVDTIKFNEK